MTGTGSYRALAAALLLAGVFFAQAFFGSRSMSLTWDEPSYIASGYHYLTSYDYRFNPSHPPLMKSLVALPLLFMEIKAAHPDREEVAALNPQAAFGYRFIYGIGNDPVKISRWCRLPAMLCGTLLVLAVFFWGRELYGDTPALLATALVAFCPNLLAQSKMATEDIGCALFMFLAVWLFRKSLVKTEVRYLLGCGLVTGLAFLAKYTALLLLPIYLILAVARCFEEGGESSVKINIIKAGAIMLIAMVVVSAAYGFNPLHHFEGIGRIYSDLNLSPTWYFFGEASDRTRWYYYIVSFLVKTPLPTLLLILLAAVVFWRYPERRKELLMLLVPVAVVVGVTCFDKGNFGVRRILPVFPFLYLFAAGGVATESRMPRFLAPLLVAWLVVDLARIYPYHISYFNNVVGGPERGPSLLLGDDSDIGQDLPALAEWQKKHPEAGALRLVYSGTADPAAYGVTATRVTYAEFENPPPGIYAVSITALVGSPWLQHAKPVARAGYSIYIYQF